MSTVQLTDIQTLFQYVLSGKQDELPADLAVKVDKELIDYMLENTMLVSNSVSHYMGILQGLYKKAFTAIPEGSDLPTELPVLSFYLPVDELGNVIKDTDVKFGDLDHMTYIAYDFVTDLKSGELVSDDIETAELIEHGLMIEFSEKVLRPEVSAILRSVYDQEGKLIDTYVDDLIYHVLRGYLGGKIVRNEDRDIHWDQAEFDAAMAKQEEAKSVEAQADAEDDAFIAQLEESAAGKLSGHEDAVVIIEDDVAVVEPEETKLH